MSSTSSALQVIDFVRALALAWKNLAAYPPGHPLLVASLKDVDRSLRELRGPAGEVTFGIASDGLLYGEVKIDVLAARKFAQALYQRGVAVLYFSNATDIRDIETFLRVLGTRAPEKSGFGDALTAAGIMNINAQAVQYTSIQVTDSLDKKDDEQPRDVWEEILRALLEHRQFASGVREAPRAASVDEIGRLIAEYAEAADEDMTFDPNATFGIRLASLDGTEHPVYRFLEQTVGQAIAHASGAQKQHALEQAVQLIRTLPHSLRKTIVRAVTQALAGDASTATMLRHFTSELPNDEVLDALRYVAAMGPTSDHAISLLQSLSTIESSTARAEAPSASVVSDLVKLFGDDDVNRFNPMDYQSQLATLTVRIPEVTDAEVMSLEQLGLRAENVAETMPQFTRVLFDMLAESGTKPPAAALLRLESVFRAHLSSGRYKEALALVTEVQELAKGRDEQYRQETELMISRLAIGDAMQDLIELLQRAAPDIALQIQKLAEALGSTAQQSLLAALAQENSRSRRRKLFDFITALGRRIIPDAVAMLNDERWYVVRNMIVLLRAVGDTSSLPAMRTLASHADLRVRLGAIKTLFALDPEVSGSLLDDLFNGTDAKMSETAVALVGSYKIKEAVDPLLRILEGNDFLGARRMLRIKAMRALGEIAEERALPSLDRFLKPTFLPWPARDERYAAWQTLHRYPEVARQPIVERGLRSSDPQIRAIAAKLAGS